MISVQNHRRQLSGNNILALLILVVAVLFSCGSSKKIVVVKPSNKPVGDHHEVIVKKQLPEKIDTIIWKELPSNNKDKVVSIEEEGRNAANWNEKTFKPLSQIKLAALIPFKSDEVDTADRNIPINNLRFVHYYAGMKMAMDEFNHVASVPVLMDVFDTGDNDQSKDILTGFQNSLPQVVIGPYKSNELKTAAEWAKKNETILISPWISSSTIADRNPYYFQAKAGLLSHYQLINDHVRNHFPIANILLISKSKEDSKLKLFNNLVDEGQEIKEEIISEEDLATRPEPILEKFLKAEDPTVFILPMASSRDENYIYHFLRRVMSEKKNKIVYVYGLYKWLEMKSEIQEYINTLNVRISISNFVDGERPEVRQFKRSYFEKYREFPSEDAMEGYDLTKFVISSLQKYGKQFYLNTELNGSDYMETQFLFKPVYKNIHDTSGEIDYFENKYIKLIEVKENKYKMID